MNRSNLLKEIKQSLQDQGYRCAPGTNFGATALLFKRIHQSRPLLLMVAVQFSRAYDDAFTGNLCVSRTLRWSYRPADCPTDMSVPIADYLRPDERSLLLDDELCGPQDVMRGWWRGFRRTNVARFIETVNTIEPRVIQREQLLAQVEHSAALAQWSMLRKNVEQRIRNGRSAPHSVQSDSATPRYSGLRHELMNEGWVEAAEEVTRESNFHIENPEAFVRNLAQEAWTLHQSGFNLQTM